MIDVAVQRYAFLALAAAALFGASAPIAKLLLGAASPLALAGLLYLGSGIGLAAVRLAWRRAPLPPFSRAELRSLAGAVVAGGIAAPVLLLWGLAGMAASSAALLLNTEAVLTALLAALLFRESVGARIWLASGVMLAAGALLAYQPGAAFGTSLHAAAVAGACALWGLDNNLTRDLAAGDPVRVAMIKGLVAGVVNFGAALALGHALPGPPGIGAALALGAASYGASLVLYILALRHLGAARTGAHFATAPFIGAASSIVLLGEPLTATFAAAAALMAAATVLVLTESHDHEHTHEPLAHTHRHRNDAHHQHVHEGREGPEPHAHPHVHEPITHRHPHLPDIHHRHDH